DEAVRVAREVHPAMVAVDVGASSLGGWDTVAALEAGAQTRGPALVLLNVADRRRAGTALGFDVWLPRPIDGDTFVAVLARLSPPGGGDAAVAVLGVWDSAART